MRKFKKAVVSLLALIMVLTLLPTTAFAASQGELVVPCQYTGVGAFQNGFATVTKDGKSGFVDTTGKEFLMGVYDSTKPFSGAGVAPVGMFVRFSGMYSVYRWGLIDTTGKLIVPLEYECIGSSMTSFPSGLVRWQRNGKYGLLGAGGQVVTPFQYDSMSSFRVDYAEVTINGKKGLIDASGREVVPCVYDSVYAISSYSSDGYAQEGMIHVVLNGRHGFVNTSGELVVPCKYDRVTNFSGGYAAVGISVGESSQANIPECRWGIVNTAGQEVVPCQYESPTSASLNPPEDGFMIVKQNGKCGVINTANQLVVPYKYDAINPFSGGYAAVWQNEKCGYINSAGKQIIPCQYDFTEGFHDGLVLLWKDGKRGYVDTAGRVAIPFQYYSAGSFYEGFAEVKKTQNGKYGYINTAGEAITPFQYDDATRFRNGIARVERNGKLGFINTAGQEIIPCIYDAVSYSGWDRYGDLVKMMKGGKCGFVNVITGKEVTPFIYDDYIYNPYGDYVGVRTSNGYGAVYTGAESGSANPAAPASTASDWARAEVASAIEAGLVPDSLQLRYQSNITREEFCRLMTALVEKATGTDINSYVRSKGLTITAPFADTNTPEVLAAYALGIVKGSGAAFNPNGSITRQEAAAMLARTARVLGLSAGTPVRFADAGTISSWAVSEVDYISGITDPGTGKQVMGGVGSQRFDPLGSYTREQAIATALRLYGAAGK